MIIVDLSQVMYATISAQVGYNGEVELEEDLVRHMVLKSLKTIYTKFRHEGYGEMIIACDHKATWRHAIFPYYKAARRKNRDASPIDWQLIHRTMAMLVQELRESFPYRVIYVEGAEGDDVIAVMAADLGKHVIVSGDHDFVQLHCNSTVQYDPIRKKYIESDNPRVQLLEKIVRGDAGDGVPNVMSPDDVFVREVDAQGKKSRQSPITKSRLAKFTNELPDGVGDETHLRNFKRNTTLIDLGCIPDGVKQSIRTDYDLQEGKKRDRLLDYFMKHNLRQLMSEIDQF